MSLDFSEEYRNEGEASDVRCNKKSISSKIYKRKYVYQGFGKVETL
jgi:hypothetical protein